MTDALPSRYNPADIEAPLYRWWLDRGAFRADAHSGRRPYVIMMPPPNVTAHLHMGHGLNNTLQDVLIRFERMRGREVLWLPGTDHAGIATQNVVERLIAQEGETRFDLGREAFVQRVWRYVEETGATILRQLEALGASCDWSRTYFTLDDSLSRAVRETFVRLHEKGLIYRGNYIINWCPRCLTALSNEEAEKEEEEGHLWSLRYPMADEDGSIVVATTRPETMLGDTAVAVHPDDERYRRYLGRRVALPLTGRTIPVVADAGVDPAFGTGAVKVTPAHDPLDFEIGQRHGLESIDILTPDGRINQAVPSAFQGLDRFEARKRVVAAFDDIGLLVGVETHRHAVGHCYRCGTVVEPRLSEQWFVRMEPLARPALRAYREGRITFLPARRGEDFAQWMEGIRDWCISRQLWWGHRIPVWYCDDPDCDRPPIVSRVDPDRCPDCGGALRQDPDVLDTWFSSWLVPISSLGWPETTADLKAFYPGHVLCTAPEILFFWVARMIMAGLEFQGELPFTTVYLHGTVRDTQHRKMSKSLGNGIDPLEVVRRFGADALRYTVVSGMAVGTDLILDPDDLDASFAVGRNFGNKLWNIGRLVLSNLPGPTRPLVGTRPSVVRRDELTLADRWILARCEATVVEATRAYEQFRLNEAAAAVYHFIWSDLADWYLEQIKPRLYGTAPGGDVAQAVVAQTFDVALRLLHPVTPFVTETLWRRFPGRPADASVAEAPWPASDRRAEDEIAVRDFTAVQELIGAVRAIRAEYGIAPGTEVTLWVSHPREAFRLEEGTIRRLAKVGALHAGDHPDQPGGHAVLADGTGVFVPLGDAVDVDRECGRLGVEEQRLAGLIAGQHRKLANEQFVTKAPAHVVDLERQKLASWEEQVGVLRQKRQLLGCR